MRIVMQVDLDSTLGCKQAHRWFKKDGRWEGVLNKRVVTLTQTDDGFDCEGIDRDTILDYFRADDDLDAIYEDCASKDGYVASLIQRCRGLRILRQPHWECIATYILATNANVKRISMMIENVCRQFGDRVGDYYAFPDPEQIVAGRDRLPLCRLGFREGRLLKFAEDVMEGRFDPDSLEGLSYEDCVSRLMEINGVGPKVADCVALFSYGHMQAFPIDARIGAILKDVYGQEGSYKRLSAFAREKFGEYCGYSQEFLYHSEGINGSQVQAGGSHPNSTS